MTSILSRLQERPLLTDVIVAASVFVVELVQALTITSSSANDEVVEPTLAIHWIVLLIAPLTLPFRRTKPMIVLGVAGLATMASWYMDLPVSGLGGMIVLYSAVIYGPKDKGVRAAIATGTTLFCFACLGVAVGEAPFYIAPLVAFTMTMPILFGMNVNAGRALLDSTQERLHEAEERRLADKMAIIQDERSRVARELHDVVAHGLSLIVVQAGAGARILDKSDVEDREETHNQVSHVIDNIDTAARQSLGEMRQILGILRNPGDPDEQWRPTPGAMTVSDLVANAKASGLNVSLTTHGEPRELPTAVGAATYRIVQEALTNVRKHGGPLAQATVTATFGEDDIRIMIDDNGRGAAADATDDGGHGLIGMKERTELLGGTFKAGPRAGGGFQVVFALPIPRMTPQDEQ